MIQLIAISDFIFLFANGLSDYFRSSTEGQWGWLYSLLSLLQIVLCSAVFPLTV